MSKPTVESNTPTPKRDSGLTPNMGKDLNPSADPPKPVNYHDIPEQKNADTDESRPSKEEEINEKQEGEWRQPGQDEYPGVENVPRGPSQGGVENPSRRYL